MDTVSRVFYAVAKDNLHTRKEIATALGVSLVTVGKAVELLTAAGVFVGLVLLDTTTGTIAWAEDIQAGLILGLMGLYEKP